MMEWKTIKDLEVLKERLKSNYNEFTQYIENYNQMQTARRNNDIIQKKITFINNIIEEFTSIEKELTNYAVKNTLRYNKGNYRIELNGNYKYRKSKVIF